VYTAGHSGQRGLHVPGQSSASQVQVWPGQRVCLSLCLSRCLPQESTALFEYWRTFTFLREGTQVGDGAKRQACL
jgi:hypothetical protein